MGVTGTSSYYHFDHQGTTQCLSNSSGGITDRFTADAWGVQVKRAGGSFNRQWYIGNWGYYGTRHHNQSYVRFRHLDYSSANWLSRDILADTVAKYTYSDNTPSRLYDPSGLYPFVDFASCADMPTKSAAQVQGSVRNMCNAISSSKRSNGLYNSIAQCANASGVSMKCLQTWCSVAKEIKCRECTKDCTIRCLCQPIISSKLTYKTIKAPCIAAENNGGACLEGRYNGNHEDGGFTLCTFYLQEYDKLCPYGPYPTVFPFAASTVFHEIGHFCSGKCDAGNLAYEASSKAFALCMAQLLLPQFT